MWQVQNFIPEIPYVLFGVRTEIYAAVKILLV